MAAATEQLVNQFRDLYLDEESSDVTILIDNVKLPAHSVVLTERCKYFKAMFSSDIEASSKRIEICETSIDAFTYVLQWMYTGTVEFKSVDDTLKGLHLADIYELLELRNLAVCFLTDNCTVDNVCSMLNVAVLLSFKSLTYFTIEFMNDKPSEILKHKSFEQLSKDALNEVLSNVMFPLSDIHIIHAVVAWMKANPTTDFDISEILENVVLHSITDEDKEALPLDVRDAVVEIVRENRNSGPIYVYNNENLALPKFGVEGFAGSVISLFEDRAEATQKYLTLSSELDNLIDLGYQVLLHFVRNLTLTQLFYFILFLSMVNNFSGTSHQMPTPEVPILEHDQSFGNRHSQIEFLN